jgi:hypothetical protein
LATLQPRDALERQLPSPAEPPVKTKRANDVGSISDTRAGAHRHAASDLTLSFSLLRMSLPARLAVVAMLVLLLWSCVLWALA